MFRIEHSSFHLMDSLWSGDWQNDLLSSTPTIRGKVCVCMHLRCVWESERGYMCILQKYKLRRVVYLPIALIAHGKTEIEFANAVPKGAQSESKGGGSWEGGGTSEPEIKYVLEMARELQNRKKRLFWNTICLHTMTLFTVCSEKCATEDNMQMDRKIWKENIYIQTHTHLSFTVQNNDMPRTSPYPYQL